MTGFYAQTDKADKTDKWKTSAHEQIVSFKTNIVCINTLMYAPTNDPPDAQGANHGSHSPT